MKVSVPVSLAFVLLGSLGRAQSTNQKPADDLYAVALRTALEERAKAASNLMAAGPSRSGFGPVTVDVNVVVEQSPQTEGLPDQLGLFRLTILDWDGMRRLSKKAGRFHYVTVAPMTNRGNRLVIRITHHSLIYESGIPILRRARYLQSVEGGLDVHFRYAQNTDGFVVEKTEGF